MTDSSLRVRLARITYHDTSGKHDKVVRYGFFTEHFNSLASRHDSTVYFPDQWDLHNGHPTELATHDLFQYLIGNTDWSVIHGHNIVHLQRPDGLATPVPYDFDFSGLVNAAYASPPPSLSIRSVRDRVFRGFCRDGVDWQHLSARMNQIREPVAHLTNRLFGHDDKVRAEITDYLRDIFELSASPVVLEQEIQSWCRRSAKH